MITLAIILTLLLAAMLVFSIFTLVTGGAFILVFGDLIVCVAIIALLVKLFQKGKK